MQAGDALCFSAVLSTRHKPWAEKLIPPYALFFGLGCVASLISILSHTTFCVDKLRSRHFGGSSGGGPNAMSIEELRMKDALDHNRFETPRALFLIRMQNRSWVRFEARKIYMYLLVGLLEASGLHAVPFAAAV